MEKLLYSVDNLPIFQNRLYKTKKEALNCKMGQIELVQNTETGLIYNSKFDEKIMIYDKFYDNEQSNSEVFQKHLLEVVHLVKNNFKIKKNIEIGCGSGFFLELLLKNGIEVIGYDPAYKGNNPNIKNIYFDNTVNASPSNIILRHVLEHIQNPYRFLNDLKNNHHQGLIYIEVPCLDWVLKKKAWFDIFYEHVNYFRLEDLISFFDVIIDCGKLFNDQYIYIIADLKTLKKTKLKTKLRFPKFFFNYNVDKFSNVIWGGSSKGVIYSIYRKKIGYPVNYVIDINPKKQGLYLPYTGLRVFSEHQAIRKFNLGKNINIMNSNYKNEIDYITNNKFNLIPIDN